MIQCTFLSLEDVLLVLRRKSFSAGGRILTPFGDASQGANLTFPHFFPAGNLCDIWAGMLAQPTASSEFLGAHLRKETGFAEPSPLPINECIGGFLGFGPTERDSGAYRTASASPQTK